MQAPSGDQTVELYAKCKAEGIRLDQYLVSQFSDLSRSTIQKAIESGAVLLNGKPTKASYKVRNHDHISIRLPDPTHDLPLPEDIPLEVLYEDEFLAIINKPSDIGGHPAKGHWSGTLFNAIQFKFPKLSQYNGDYRPGIVHRLDPDTSGAILVAKEEQTHRDLSMQFERRKVFKEYVALTAGVPDRDSDYIEGRIAHHPHDRIKLIVTAEEETAPAPSSFHKVLHP